MVMSTARKYVRADAFGKDEETAKVKVMPVTNTMYDMYENAGQTLPISYSY